MNIQKGKNTFFHNIGLSLYKRIEVLGELTLFVLSTLRTLKSVWKNRKLSYEQMYHTGILSMPLILITASFTGMVAAIQVSYQSKGLIPLSYLGVAIQKMIQVELAPILTGLVIAGRVGSSIAAEIGSMKVTEQIDALESMALDPYAFLVQPRLIALMIMVPVLTIFANTLAILSASVISMVTPGIGLSPEHLAEGLRKFYVFKDVWSGLLNAEMFGIIIAIVGCFYGFRTQGGAVGVGKATTQSVVVSMLMIFIVHYMLAEMIF